HAARGDLDAANDIAAADHHGDFGALLLRRDQVGGDAIDGRLVDAVAVAAGEIFAGQLDHDATIDRLSHLLIALLSAGPLPARARREDFRLLLLAAGCCDFGREVAVLLVDSLAES